MPGQDAYIGPATAGATHTFDQLAAQHDALLGQIVGNYHLLARAGEGTSGCVYRARDVRLDRAVAVKLLHAGASKARFEQEARALARLGIHPGVVDVYTWGEHDGNCYLALEYLPESAASLLARRPGGLDSTLAIRIAVQCAQALAAAHREGVIHGDIKPSNILLSGNGAVAKLCDFGMSSLGVETAPRGGTPAYLAPECASGAPASKLSDIYSLGATIFAMLTGAPPIVETDAAEAMHAAAHGRIRPLAAARPDLGARLVDVVTQALAQDPACRFASAKEFAAALQDLIPPVLTAGEAIAAKPRWRIARAAGMAAAVLAATFMVILGQSLLPGGGGSTVLLADARLNLDQGKYEVARKGFEEYLAKQPNSTEAHYGLAYSFLLEGEHERAAKEFSAIGESAMQTEGKAAVAYMASGEAARPTLERAANDTPGGYAAVLLSMLDMMAGKFDDAKARIENVKEDQLKFDWQRRQYLQTLGQIYFKSGDYSHAETVFAKLEQTGAGAPATAGVAADYVELSRERAATVERKDSSDQIARLKALMKDTPPAADADTWTSRPLRIWIPPVEARQGLILQESGLADVLPWRLSRALLEDKEIPVTPVERGAEGAALAEQELSASLSNPDEAIRLGRVMGARLLLVTKVTRLFNEELMHLSLVDTETTRLTPVGEYKVARDLDLKAWMDQLHNELVAAIAHAYPLRGRVTAKGNDLSLNIGADVGVKAGTRFQIIPAPNAQPLEGVDAIVTGKIESANSGVELHGAPANAVPAEGWMVEQVVASKVPANAT